MQRYTNTRPTPLRPDDDGEWCLWKDSLALNAELVAAAKEVVRYIPDQLFSDTSVKQRLIVAIAKATEIGGER